MNKHASLLFILAVLFIGLAACQPAPAASTPTLEPATPGVETLLPTNTLPAATATSEPAATIPSPTLAGGSIPHLPAGSKIILKSTQMLTATNGWGIGREENGLVDHILRTLDGGGTWREVTPPESIDATKGHEALAYFKDDRSAWVAYSLSQPYPVPGNALIWFTRDGGQTWNSGTLDLSGIDEFYSPGEISFPDAQHGWMLAHVGAGMMHDYVVLFYTDDGGQTWSRLADPYTPQTFPMVCCKTGMAFTDATHGWLTGDTHAVEPGIFFYNTDDGGVTWTAVNLNGPAENPGIFSDQSFGCGTYSPNFIDAQHGSFLVNCTNYNNLNNKPTWLYTTGDGGTTWASHAMPAMTGHIQMIDPLNGYYIAGRIYKTTDGGNSWNLVIPVTWDGLPDFIDLDHGWIVAKKDDNVALVRTVNAAMNWDILETTIVP